jgi:ferredoxin
VLRPHNPGEEQCAGHEVRTDQTRVVRSRPSLPQTPILYRTDSKRGDPMFREDQCTLCGDCLAECLYIQIGEEESRREFQNLINGKPSRVISECVSCMACDELCPEKANPFSLIIRRQEESGEFNRFEKIRDNMKGAYSIPTTIQKGARGGPPSLISAPSTQCSPGYSMAHSSMVRPS